MPPLQEFEAEDVQHFSNRRQSSTGCVVVTTTCVTSPLPHITSKTKKSKDEPSSCQCTTTLYGEKKETKNCVLRVVSAKSAKNWGIEGEKKRITRKEFQRLLNNFDMEGRDVESFVDLSWGEIPWRGLMNCLSVGLFLVRWCVWCLM